MPNAVQGFSQNRDKPIHIDAAQLEVRDKDHVATFSGDVKVVQGDTTMRARTLQVFYDQQAPQAAKGVQGGGEIRDARPPAAIRRSAGWRRRATSSSRRRIRSSPARPACSTCAPTPSRCTGGVVLTQGDNVLKGDRLVVNMTTGISKIEMDAGRRVDVLINPKSGDGKGPADARAPPPRRRPGAGKDGAKDTQAPGHPVRLNAAPAYSRPAG